MKLSIILFLMLSINAFGHGDHHIPGSIPPSPNGGVLKEAKKGHSHKHGHHHGKRKEIFIEAKMKGKVIDVFPLELDPKTNKKFFGLDINKFTDVKISIEDPRKKEVITSEYTGGNSKWLVTLGNTRSRRYIVSFSGNFEGENYKAKIQVEKK